MTRRDDLLAGKPLRKLAEINPLAKPDPAQQKIPDAPIVINRATQAMPKLAILIPSFSTFMADTSMAVAAMFAYGTAHAGQALLNEKSSMVSRARNNLVENALKMGAEFLLFVDSDLTFPSDAAVRLMKHDLDIVGATYNKRVPPFQTLGALKGPQRDLSTGGLAEADYMPGGFLMVKAGVFQRLGWPWFFETYTRPGTALESFDAMMRDNFAVQPSDEVIEAIKAAPGFAEWCENNIKAESADHMMSEDYNFCRKARRAGYQIWCDLDLTWQMAHIGEQAVTCTRPEPEKAEAAKTPAVVDI